MHPGCICGHLHVRLAMQERLPEVAMLLCGYRYKHGEQGPGDPEGYVRYPEKEKR